MNRTLKKRVRLGFGTDKLRYLLSLRVHPLIALRLVLLLLIRSVYFLFKVGFCHV